MLDQVMLDLETLDNVETAVILSIGAVRFDLTTEELGDQFYCVVDPADCQKHGLTIGAATVFWWMQQSKEAQTAVFTADSLPLLKALQDFTFYIEKVKGTSVWGNGSTFDNMIIRNAYRRCSLPIPWSFRNDLCFRTMLRMFPGTKKSNEGIEHNALDDARRQAKSLIQIVKGLKR